MILVIIAITFELIAFIISLFYYKKTKGTYMQWMAPFLFYTCFTELLGFYMHYSLNKPTLGIHLFLDIITVIFYTYIFSNLLNSNKLIKRIMIIIALILILSYAFIFFFIPNFFELNYRLNIIDGFYYSILSCYYLYKEFANDNLDEFLIKKPGFWIATGALLFYSVTAIVRSLHSTTSKNSIYIFGLPIHLFFACILSMILYACFSIAMIVWKKPLPK